MRAHHSVPQKSQKPIGRFSAIKRRSTMLENHLEVYKKWILLSLMGEFALGVFHRPPKHLLGYPVM